MLSPGSFQPPLQGSCNHALQRSSGPAQALPVPQDGKVAAEVEGADAPGLSKQVAAHFRQAAPGGSVPTPTAAPARPPQSAPQPSEQSAEVTERIRKLLGSAPVLLFMKGTPEAPRCGFSAKTVAALRDAGVQFQTFDILQDEAVRQGLKAGRPALLV